MSEKACTDLMKAMGSPNGQWRPEPEKHAVARMNRSISEVDRAVAWALIGCTRPGHFCSFVLTEDYKAAGARHLQKAEGWASIKTAERVIREAEKLGYFRRPASENRGGVTQKSFSWRMLILKDLTSMTKKGMEPVQVPSKQPSIPPRSSPRSPALMPPRARAPKHSRNLSQSWQKMPSRKL